MFLRADDYNPKNAATRLVKFMEGKLKYFGSDPLARPIEYSDLDNDTIQCLRSGVMQILPCRDRAGRAILCDMNTMFPKLFCICCFAPRKTTNLKDVEWYF